MKKTIFTIAMLAIGLNVQAQITDTGTNVGIGITTPAAKLHIQNSNSTEVYNTYFGGNSLHFDRSGNGASYIDKTDIGDLILRFGLPVVNRFTFTNDGKLGVGTTTPRSRIDLGGNVGANNGLRVGDYVEINERETINNAAVIGFNASIDAIDVSKFKPTWTGSTNASGMIMSMKTGGVSDLTFYGYKWGTDSTPRSLDEFTKLFHIGTNGNIGVGTTTPNTKLEIYHNSKRTVEINPQNQLDVKGNSSLTIKEFVPSIEFHDSSTSSASAVTFANNNKFYIGKKTGTSLSSSSLFNVDLNNGNVGIGTTTPTTTLDVKGIITSRNEIRASSSNPGFLLDESDVSDKNWHIQVNGGNLKFYEVNDARSSWSQKMFIEASSGNIGIGTTTTGSHKLAVEGSIGAREIKVEASGWSDFVFENDYNLPSLQEVEKHINEKGHLQNIPSAAEVKKDGFFLGEMDAKLLQKIEELTLYTIQQEKQLQEQKKEMLKQSEEIEELKTQNRKLLRLAKEIEDIKQKMK